MLFHPVEECRHTATMLLGGVQQFRLVHGDPHWQPRPYRQQLNLTNLIVKSTIQMSEIRLTRHKTRVHTNDKDKTLS